MYAVNACGGGATGLIFGCRGELRAFGLVAADVWVGGGGGLCWVESLSMITRSSLPYWSYNQYFRISCHLKLWKVIYGTIQDLKSTFPCKIGRRAFKHGNTSQSHSAMRNVNDWKFLWPSRSSTSIILQMILSCIIRGILWCFSVNSIYIQRSLDRQI